MSGDIQWHSLNFQNYFFFLILENDKNGTFVLILELNHFFTECMAWITCGFICMSPEIYSPHFWHGASCVCGGLQVRFCKEWWCIFINPSPHQAISTIQSIFPYHVWAENLTDWIKSWDLRREVEKNFKLSFSVDFTSSNLVNLMMEMIEFSASGSLKMFRPVSSMQNGENCILHLGGKECIWSLQMP